MNIRELTVTGTELGAVLDLTDRRCRQLAESGVFNRSARGRYPLAQCVQAYVATIEARGDDDDLAAARLALVKAQTVRVTLDNDRKLATAREMDATESAVTAFSILLLLRLRPLSTWLYELINKRDGVSDHAVEIAGEAHNWICAARGEVEVEVKEALAEARRRGVLIQHYDDLLAVLGRQPVDGDGQDDAEPTKPNGTMQ